MNNEPVAWRSQSPDGYWSLYGAPVAGAEPLYTHPVELIDEEIISLYESSYLQSGLDEWEFDPVYFARAILRKAKEK